MCKNLHNKFTTGFTLIETILVVALIGIITAVGSPLFSGSLQSSDLDTAESTLVANLVHARSASMAVEGDSSWGVYVATGAVTMFKGSSHALRDTDFDQTGSLPGTVTLTGDNEVVFNKLTGNTTITEFVLTGSNNQVKNININSKGMIDY